MFLWQRVVLVRFGDRRKVNYPLESENFPVEQSMLESGLESSMKLVASSRQLLEVVVYLFAVTLNAILTGMESAEYLVVVMVERKL